METKNGAGIDNTDIMAHEVITLDDYIEEVNDKPPLSKDYIAGLIDGEGCFALNVNNCVYMRFALGLKATSSNLDILKKVLYTLSMGSIGKAMMMEYDYTANGKNGPTNMHPQHRFTIGRFREMKRFAKWIEDGVPLMVKREEYLIWREALYHYDKHRIGPGRGRSNEISLEKEGRPDSTLTKWI